MQQIEVDIKSVKLNPDNPRSIRDIRFKSLLKSVQDFPEMLKLRPIVVDSDMVVLGGNMRLRACQKAGMKKVWIIRADELTEEQKREFIIKDNVGFGDWDTDLLANEWDQEKLIEWGYESASFFQEEPEAVEDDYTQPETIQTDIVLGDLFEIGEHRLICGDSTDSDAVAKLMNGEKADLLLTDLPYGVSYADKNEFLNNNDNGDRNQNEIENDHLTPEQLYNFAREVYTTILSFMQPVSSYYAFMPQGGEQMMMMMNALTDSGFKVKHELIWVKNNHVLGRADYNYKHEPICYGWTKNGTHKFYGDFSTSIFEFDKPKSSKLHPTMKPVELLGQLITNSSELGGIVLDPTIGSGTTMVAAHQLKRKCYGMELDPKYCQVIIDRMRKLDPDLVIKKNGVVYN